MHKVQRRNLQIIGEHISILKQYEDGKILLLSPNFFDFRFWKINMPRAHFTVSSIHDWNLNFEFRTSKLKKLLCVTRRKSKHRLFDLVIAQNVFMYLSKPEKSLGYIANISNSLLIQDLKYRKRSSLPQFFGTDGDVSRYCIYDTGKITQPSHKIGLILDTHEIDFQLEYEGEGNEFHDMFDPPLHILVLVKFKPELLLHNFLNLYSHFSIFKLYLTTGLQNLKKQIKFY